MTISEDFLTMETVLKLMFSQKIKSLMDL